MMWRMAMTRVLYCTVPSIPMVLCEGCAASIKQSGIVQHCCLSRNLACRTFLQDHIRTTAENQENLEAYMHDDDEIGTEIMFSLSFY
jgi:hypothetical protein